VKLELDNSEKCLTPCRKCGGVDGMVRDGAGPHAKRIDCVACGGFINWMPMALAIQLGLYVPLMPGE